MYRIRYYDRYFSPSDLTGKSGTVIRALNWLRWKLEVFVQRLMVGYLAKESNLSKREKQSILDQFRVDVLVEKLESVSVALPNSVPTLSRADKYVVHGGTLLDEVPEAAAPPIRPVDATDMIARYVNPKMYKYAKSRKSVVLREDAFEPMEKKDAN